MTPIFPPPPPSAAIPHPSTVVPYLFGGLAAMLALIALALLILACSYLRHTANMQREADPEAQKLEENGKAAAAAVVRETVVVIMAGDVNPSFLGTAVAVSVSGDECCCGEKTDDKKKKLENEENPKEEAEEEEGSC